VQRRDFVALAATELVLPMAAGFHALDGTIVIGDLPEASVWLKGVPSQPLPNHAVWVDLMAAVDGEAPTGLNCRVEYPAGAVRVLAVESGWLAVRFAGDCGHAQSGPHQPVGANASSAAIVRLAGAAAGLHRQLGGAVR
jgi:hypothetical protein